MHYLKRVIAVLENKKYEADIRKLGQALQEQDVEFEYWEMKFDLKKENRREISGQATPTNTRWADNITTSDLCITDNSQYAVSLQQQGKAVLAFLHADNRKQDFSTILYACENPKELDASYMEEVYRRYNRIPWDILETERCYIRETMVEDVDAFYKIYSEPEITRYTEGLFAEREEQIQYFNDYIDKFYGFYNFGIWTIIEKASGKIIGRAGFSCREGFEDPEIGFVIGLPWQGNGFAKEVCRAILKYGREELGFTRVQAFVRPENIASLQLCEKLGMRNMGDVTLNSQRYYHMYLEYHKYL